MAQVEHGSRKHALLSASGASRWLNCPPSPRLEEKFKEPKTSAFAEEGTLAHEFADLALQNEAKVLDTAKFIKAKIPLKLDPLYSKEMDAEVQKYVDYAMEEFNAAKARTVDAKLIIEQRVDLTDYIENGFGTDDAIIIDDHNWVCPL